MQNYICLFGNESMKLFSVEKITALQNAAWIGFPIDSHEIVFGNVGNTSLAISSIIAIMPIAVATMMEHIGDISAISATVGKNFINRPRPAPHAAGRRAGYDPGFPVRRPGQHHLR